MMLLLFSVGFVWFCWECLLCLFFVVICCAVKKRKTSQAFRARQSHTQYNLRTRTQCLRRTHFSPCLLSSLFVCCTLLLCCESCCPLLVCCERCCPLLSPSSLSLSLFWLNISLFFVFFSNFERKHLFSFFDSSLPLQNAELLGKLRRQFGSNHEICRNYKSPF